MEIFDDDEWVSADYVARQLDLPPKWVYRNRHALGIPGKSFGRKVRFNKRLLIQWIERQP
jgi:hypothetical protein